MSDVLRVKDWDDRFESAKSRTYKIKSQTYMPNKQGLGYNRIMRAKNGVSIYGAWCAMIGWLSRMEAPRKGYITDTGRLDGMALNSEDIGAMTLVEPSIIEKMLYICSSKDVGWIVFTRVGDTEKDTTVSCQSPDNPLTSSSPSPLPLPLPLPSSPRIGGDVDFERFWKAYPRKIGKKAALKAWGNSKDKPDIETVLASVATHATSEQWRKDGGQFIPHPATFINQGRWMDEVTRTVDNGSGPPREWSMARDACSNAIWDCVEQNGKEDEESARKVAAACRDKFKDVPKYMGKDAVTVGLGIAWNNKRVEKK